MFILTSQTFDTNKATIHSAPESGCRVLYRATCTSGELYAARAVVRKYFGDAAAESVRLVTSQEEIRSLTGNYFDNPRRKQVFGVYAFNPRAKA
jgi:hypothetical protein